MSGSKPGSKYLLIASLGALGVVFGDIGTSPLYAFRESFLAAEGLAVNKDSVLGILSLMFWALVLIVTVKYLVFVMRADNDGEGGILALTALAVGSGASATKTAGRTLLVVGFFGTALLYGDGVITPAISVLSAIEGLEVVAPGLDHFVEPAAAVILVALFAIQRQGTARVGAVFGPIMIVWFSVLAVTGLFQVLNHPSVLVAISPAYAIGFFVSNPRFAFLSLGAVFLVVTGSEALYADMGHFGKRPIRASWFVMVFPSLLINYFGQGALLIAEPTAISNPFYSMVPDWGRIPMIFLATAAAVIASQALISGAFSLTLQAVQLGLLPRVRIDHTSPREFGQVYLGSVNYLLMIACVGTVFVFGSASNLAAAYGVAVTTTMVITTMLLFVVMRTRWGWGLPASLALTGGFLIVDLAFFSANIIKIPQGGWFPLAIGILVLSQILTWRRGRAALTAKLKRAQLPIERFIGSIVDHPQRRVPGTSVFMFPEAGATPPALLANLRNNNVIHETVLIVSVQTATVPRVPRVKRATVHPLGEGFYQVVLHFGFYDKPDVPTALSEIVMTDFGFDPTDAVYVIGKETVLVGPGHLWDQLRTGLFAAMHRNSVNAAQFFSLPPKDVMEIGQQVEL